MSTVVSVVNKNMYVAALSHYTALAHEAKAHLELCFNNPVAVGEHTDLLSEIKKWTRNLADAEESLATLKSHFTDRHPTVI